MGIMAYRQIMQRPYELYNRAGELGHAAAKYNIGTAYRHGNGGERDEKKPNHYYELAAMGGDVDARHNIGCSEYQAGTYNRALKHFMLAAGCGSKESLSAIQEIFKKGHATKEDYTHKPYERIKHTWARLRVFKGMKLLQLLSFTNIIECLSIPTTVIVSNMLSFLIKEKLSILE